MRDITCFSNHVLAQFDGSAENMKKFGALLMDASHGVYDEYSKEETNTVIRKMFNKIMGIADWKTASAMQRRQAWRLHNKELASLIEEVVADKMNTGWAEKNSEVFMQFVKEINIAEGDKNEVLVEDKSLLQVSKFAGDHIDVVRQYCKPGKAYTIETSWYVIKVYADYNMFQLGKIDFAKMVDKMYQSIEQYRYGALYTAFMSADTSLPSDLVLSTAVSASTVDAIKNKIEAVEAACGKNVMLVGTRTAISKLQSTVSYNMYSDDMKDEANQKGILANWEGYTCYGLNRVNKAGTRDSVFSDDDNKKIFIIPIDPEGFIYRVNEGDVVYTEAGMTNPKKDMTVDAQIAYQEGIAVVISEDFGVIKITG